MLSKIRFSPPLDIVNRLSVEHSFNGVYSKCVLVYDTPWWTEKGFSGSSATPEGYARVTFDTSDGVHPTSEDKAALEAGLTPRQYSLTAFITGPRGAAWSALSAEERKAVVLAEVSSAFEAEEAKHPSEVFEMEWMNDEWARGAPAALLPPGQFLPLCGAFSEPEGNMFFAGTENATDHPGYMEGAVIAGKAAAQGVLALLAGM